MIYFALNLFKLNLYPGELIHSPHISYLCESAGEVVDIRASFFKQTVASS